MTYRQFCNVVQQKVAYDYDMGRTETQATLHHAFRTILAAVRRGDTVSVDGFGVFRLHVVKPRYNVLPNGKMAYVRKRSELWFRPTVNVQEASREETVSKNKRGGRVTGPHRPAQAAAINRAGRKRQHRQPEPRARSKQRGSG